MTPAPETLPLGDGGDMASRCLPSPTPKSAGLGTPRSGDGFTPGPWFYEAGGFGAAIVSPHGGSLAATWPADLLGYRHDAEANARLIAAAPELLEALSELADLMLGVIDGHYRPDS